MNGRGIVQMEEGGQRLELKKEQFSTKMEDKGSRMWFRRVKDHNFSDNPIDFIPGYEMFQLSWDIFFFPCFL